MESFGTWLEKLQKQVLPKSPIGEAVGYSLNQWKALNVYITDGRLSIDNNVAERAIKPYAIGRRNWLFFGSDNGGRTLSILSSFTATCLMHKINPWEYLRDVLIRLPITPKEQLPMMLP
ncbi:transposase [Telmatocola sphagniphila]|uniref:Transposase n=1 Tax=Telmatocola sphagniphila TaxID=1123043 RepID=A0A8E6B4N7_9BACT|nr:transposase [Telmatocola sphagniphila]